MLTLLTKDVRNLEKKKFFALFARSVVGVSKLNAMHWRECPPELTHPNIASLVLPSLLPGKKEGGKLFLIFRTALYVNPWFVGLR